MNPTLILAIGFDVSVVLVVVGVWLYQRDRQRPQARARRRRQAAAIPDHIKTTRGGLQIGIDGPDGTTDTAQNPRCQGCGGPHPFDTSVPSVVWNRAIRENGIPDYLCLTCIVKAFAYFGDSFTAELWGGQFDGLPIEVRFRGTIAEDAKRISDENTALRVRIRELEGTHTARGSEPSEWQ